MDSFVVPLEEMESSDTTGLGCFKEEPQQIVVVTTNSETTTNNIIHEVAHGGTIVEQVEPCEEQGNVKTVIINEEAFLDQHVEQQLEVGVNGEIILDETSGAVASVLSEVPNSQDHETLMESILPDHMSTADFVAEATGTDDNLTEEQVVHEEIMLTDGEQEVTMSNGIGSDFFVGQNAVVQIQEEEIIETPSASETEMSVAMEMAKLSQGLSNNSSYDDLQYSDTENTTPPPSIQELTPETPAGEKPRMSYAQLIAEALMSREDRMMTLSEIYQAISNRYEYYSMGVKSWQNAIRHNLTLNPSFSKIPRPSQEGRGNYWRMEPGSEKVIFRRQIRNHQYQRTKSETKAARKSKVVYLPSQQLKLENEALEENQSKQQIVVSSPVVSSASTTTPVMQKRVMIVQKSPQVLNGQKIILAGNQQIKIINQNGQLVQGQPTFLQNGRKNGSIVFIALPKSKVLKTENA